MTLMRMPLFCWTTLASSTLMIFAFPALTVTTALLALDRVFDMHFFTMGASAGVNAFFGIATMVIAVPTGVKVFDWLMTLFRGRITFHPSMLWILGFGAAALIQVLVHLHYFLHLGLRSTPPERLLAITFAAVLILIMIGGSQWVMFNLHYQMWA